jgi:hypothetical protein
VRSRLTAALVLSVLLACNQSSSPTAPSPVNQESLPHGRLSGVVTIGPNCPVESETNPCPTQPSAYALRKILVYDEAKTKLIATVDIDQHGLYLIDLPPAKYLVDLKPTGIDRSGEVPTTVTIQNNVVTKLDINIDTGLR